MTSRDETLNELRVLLRMNKESDCESSNAYTSVLQLGFEACDNQTGTTEQDLSIIDLFDNTEFDTIFSDDFSFD